MACSHSAGCPLFPKLNASLRGWRDAYCDSDTEWRSCARYTQSLTGRSVPITLLPNGKYAHTMTRTAPGSGSVTASGTGPVPARSSRFASLPRVATAPPGSPFEQAPAQAAPPLVRPPTPAATAPTPPPPTGRSWSTRLVDWMRGPA